MHAQRSYGTVVDCLGSSRRAASQHLAHEAPRPCQRCARPIATDRPRLVLRGGIPESQHSTYSAAMSRSE